jgi:uncharacterized protein
MPISSASTCLPNAKRQRSHYIEMRDGVRIAANLYFPDAQAFPPPWTCVLIQTRYGRARLIPGKGEGFINRINDIGHALAIIDVRGSTSSYGDRMVELGDDEAADMDDIIAHLAAAEWSNGSVFATGYSYDAATAEVATSRPAPALKGAIIFELEVDPYAQLFMPGGVRNVWMHQGWGLLSYHLDRGRSLNVEVGSGHQADDCLDCVARKEDCARVYPYLQPVDGDDDYTLLQAALRNRRSWQPADYDQIVCRDDLAGNGYSMAQSAPGRHMDAIRAQAKPVQLWGSWMDGATAAGALARYASTPDAPVELWITANDHAQRNFCDPYFPDDRTPRPDFDQKLELARQFIDRVERGQHASRIIHYYVLGSHRFQQSDVWPPSGTHERTLFLTTNGLRDTSGQTATVKHAVDFSAGTGAATRWSAQGGASPAYPDRRDADGKLLCFDSAPFDADTELAGTPVLHLRLAAQSQDPAIFAYLEDIDPDGRVTYLTEGMLRAIHRRPLATGLLPYDAGPAAHSFARNDVLPVTPGEAMTLAFALFPVAALIRRGHRLRLAIGGGDCDYFERLSDGAPEQSELEVGGTDPSRLTIHTKPWEHML